LARKRKNRLLFVDGNHNVPFAGLQLEHAFKGNMAAWILLNSSPSGARERLSDYLPSMSWEDNPWLEGWVHARHLPKPCFFCGKRGIGNEMHEGDGCVSCDGFGRNGHQMVVDIWERKENGCVCTFNAKDQAVCLIQKGLVCPDAADNILGLYSTQARAKT